MTNRESTRGGNRDPHPPSEPPVSGNRQIGNISPDFDAIVIGSGFGGAVAACRLGQAGLSVLVLERGRRFLPSDFPDLPGKNSFLPALDEWSYAGHCGPFDLRDLGDLTVVTAAGYGGGSLLYAAVHLRPPASVFADWPARVRRAELDPYFDLAGYMLDVAPIDEHQLPALSKTRTFDAVSARLGRTAFHPPLGISRHTGPNAFGVPMKACTGCGSCCSGCREGAKTSLDKNYLAIAEALPNVHFKTRCEVLRINELADGSDGYAVEFEDRLLQAKVAQVRARFVFVAAGALGTQRLLARSRASSRKEPGRGLARLSERLGCGFFSNGDALGVAFDTQERSEPSLGPTITSSLLHHEPSGFVLLQDGGFAPELTRLLQSFAAKAWLAKNRFREHPPRRAPSDVASMNAAAVNDAEHAHQALGSAERRSPLEQLVLAATLGDLDAVLPRQLEAALTALRDEWILDSRPDFTRAIDELLRLSAESFVDRITAGWLHRVPGLRARATRIARKLGERLIADTAQLTDRAQRSFFEHFLVLDPKRGVRSQLSRHLTHATRDPSRSMMLLTMGEDTAPSRLTFDEERDCLRVTPRNRDSQRVLLNGERLARDWSTEAGAELRTNPFWAHLGKAVSVHPQGGCALSSSPEHGVLTPEGEVHGHPGLFVVDASAFPGSVGVNPSATVLALAERQMLAFIRRFKANPVWPLGDNATGARAFAEQQRLAQEWRARVANYSLEPPSDASPPLRSRPLGLRFREQFSGFLSETVEPLERDEDFAEAERRGSQHGLTTLELSVEIEDLESFWLDERHEARVSGSARLSLPSRSSEVSFAIDGALRFFVNAEASAPGSELVYHLTGSDDRLRRWRLGMVKPMAPVADRNAWARMTRARTTCTSAGASFAGILRVDLASFFQGQLPSLEVTGTRDPARIGWAMAAFSDFFWRGLLPTKAGSADRADSIVSVGSPPSRLHAARAGERHALSALDERMIRGA